MIKALAVSSMRLARHHTLLFHRVLNEQDPMSPDEPTADWFRVLVKWLAGSFEVISLEEAVTRAGNHRQHGPTVSITFDDGYADNFLVALPILEEFAVPATFFVASSFIDGGRMWNDSIIETARRLQPGSYSLDGVNPGSYEISDWASRRQLASAAITAWKHMPPQDRQDKVDTFSTLVDGLPVDLMMTKAQLRRLADSRLSTVGGHTRTHPILAALQDDAAREEITSGKRDLEEWLQKDVTLFAYPNGKLGRDYLCKHAEFAKEAGFRAAVATDWGTMDAATDLYAIPRFTPWHTNLTRFSVDMARCHFGLI